MIVRIIPRRTRILTVKSDFCLQRTDGHFFSFKSHLDKLTDLDKEAFLVNIRKMP